ncbi:MAG: SDR family NAD(P)-dependent oxidoreductase [Actinobacteria bacterium]|nr:SDR family NAD(P)-dependent oxidoreductase [Actinomycetota bacterium]
MKDLNGKVVLITGAARGMGRLQAMNFAREGARVAITDIDAAELEKTAGEMRDAGYDVHHYLLDISDREACFRVVEQVESELGPIDVLVNNAAVAMNETVLDTPEEHYRRITDVNYLGQVWMMQAAVPGMVRRGCGHLVNMCSVAGKVAAPFLGPYCATKFALIGITDCIRQELRGSGVNFTIVNPGYIATGMFEGSKPPILTGWVDPQKVADTVVDAVKKNKAEIFVPRAIMRLTAFVRGLGLPKMTDFLFGIVGLGKSFAGMQKDRGRPF